MADDSINQNVGWGFPFRFDRTGRVGHVGGKADEVPNKAELREAFRDDAFHMLSTGRHERVMHPNFGIDSKLYLFDPVQPTQPALMRIEVADQFQLWVPRLRLNGISVDVNPTQAKVGFAISVESAEFPLDALIELTS